MTITFEQSNDQSTAFNELIHSISQKMNLMELKTTIKKWQEGSEKSKTFSLSAFSQKPTEKSIEEVKNYLKENFLELAAIRSSDDYSLNRKESGSVFLVNKKNHDFFVLNYVPNPSTKHDIAGFNMKYYPSIDKYLKQILGNIQTAKTMSKPLQRINDKNEQQLLMLVEVLNIRYEKFLFESETASKLKDTEKQKAKI